MLEEEIEEEVDLPGWDEDYIDMLTTMYEEDVDRIAAVPTIDFIEP